MFSPISRAWSPRMVPGADLTGSVAPARARNASTARGPSSTIATSGPRGDELDQLAEERLLRVLGVVRLGGVDVQGAQVHRHDLEALALDAGDHVADEAARHPVGLDQDKSALGH